MLNTVEAVKKLLRVAIVGCPNAGKSTLLNRILDQEISTVSKKVHTTRRNVLGVLTHSDTQLEFYDSPGLVNRRHLLKHRLEDSLLVDPSRATEQCDLIAVLVDASNERERWRLNKGLLRLLENHQNKRSILVLNKVDLVKDKRFLMDIGTRLTQGFLDGKPCIEKYLIKRMSREEIIRLNLTAHLGRKFFEEYIDRERSKLKHKYVIELNGEEELENRTQITPDHIGFQNFSQIHSISALNNDGVDELKQALLDYAYPVEKWPHGPTYVSNQNTRDIVHGIIRGRVLEYVDHEVPYLVHYKYLVCDYDEMGSLHVHLEIRCPKTYMVAKVLGTSGVNITRIVSESRELICKTLACDVKLHILVEASRGKSVE